jgi:hypothetical protein
MLTTGLNHYDQQQQQLPPDFRSLLSADELLRLTLSAQASCQSDSQQKAVPQNLLTFLTYAYVTGRLATENMMDEFANDAALRYICYNRCPGNRTIRSFRRYHRDVLIKCMAQTMFLCMSKLAEIPANQYKYSPEYLNPMTDAASYPIHAGAEAEYRVNRAAQLDCMAMDE